MEPFPRSAAPGPAATVRAPARPRHTAPVSDRTRSTGSPPARSGNCWRRTQGCPWYSLAAAARRLAGALNAGQPANDFDLGVVARVPIVLAARARQAAPAAQALHGIPDRTQTPNVTVVDLFAEPAPPHATVQAPRPEPSHDDSVPSSPQPADAPKKTAPDRRKRLSQKAARAVVDSARLVKGADHRETRRWDLITEDGTVLGYVEPSYGGTGRTGRNGSPPHQR